MAPSNAGTSGACGRTSGSDASTPRFGMLAPQRHAVQHAELPARFNLGHRQFVGNRGSPPVAGVAGRQTSRFGNRSWRSQ